MLLDQCVWGMCVCVVRVCVCVCLCVYLPFESIPKLTAYLVLSYLPSDTGGKMEEKLASGGWVRALFLSPFPLSGMYGRGIGWGILGSGILMGLIQKRQEKVPQ